MKPDRMNGFYKNQWLKNIHGEYEEKLQFLNPLEALATAEQVGTNSRKVLNDTTGKETQKTGIWWRKMNRNQRVLNKEKKNSTRMEKYNVIWNFIWYYAWFSSLSA